MRSDYCNLHVAEEETEAQMGYVTCPSSLVQVLRCGARIQNEEI